MIRNPRKVEPGRHAIWEAVSLAFLICAGLAYLLGFPIYWLSQAFGPT